MTEGLTWADMCGTGTASKGPGSSQTGAPKATQGQKQHPAVGMPQVRNYHPQH